MAQYVHSGRNRPCPVCGRTKDPDCRWNDEVVFCHTYVEQDGQASGYVYRGATADGLWGQYFPVSSQVEKPVRPSDGRTFSIPAGMDSP
jgi:hypothetical protein